LRIKEQETHLILYEHDDDDDDEVLPPAFMCTLLVPQHVNL